MDNQHLKKSILINSFFNIIKTASGVMFPLITFSYSSKILGADGIGKVNFVRSIILYFSTFAMLGMNYYGTREAAKLRDDRDKLSKFTHEMLFVNAISTTVAYIALFFCITYVDKLQSYKLLLVINGISILMMGMGMEWLYQALEEYRYIALRTILFQVLALVIMFLTVRNSDDVANYMIVSTLATYGFYIINFIRCRKFVSFRWYGDYKINGHLKPILKLFAMVVSIELYTLLDSTMLGFIKGDDAVGIYSAALKINKISNSLITSLGIVLIPRLSYYVGMNEKEQFKELVNKAYHFIFMFSIPIFMGLFLLSGEIIRMVCGDDFIPAILTMRIMTPIVLVIPFSVVTNEQVFIPLNKEKYILASTLIGAVINFCLNMLLIPRYSYNGAAIATVVAESMVTIVCFINLNKTLDIWYIFRGYWQYWISTISILIVVCFIKLLNLGLILTITVSIILSVLLYWGILILLRNVYLIELLGVLKNKIGSE